mmetsp:Transcript_10016/g.42096  ORF Transcript_10016/g.42096 Transcript_10016/m.42096 type:complete len:218 (-) Transcript_10016:139-792(-)
MRRRLGVQHEHVPRLQVPVREPRRAGLQVAHRAGHLPGDRQPLRQGGDAASADRAHHRRNVIRIAARIQPLLERAASARARDDPAVVGGGQTRAVEGQDVRMPRARQRADLPQEGSGARRRVDADALGGDERAAPSRERDFARGSFSENRPDRVGRAVRGIRGVGGARGGARLGGTDLELGSVDQPAAGARGLDERGQGRPRVLWAARNRALGRRHW